MEKTMNRIKFLIAVSAFSLLVLGLPAIASAQWKGNRNDSYWGNERYDRNIRGTVEHLKNGARQFEHQLDRGNNGWGRFTDRNSNRGLRLLADDFTAATRDLANAYGRGRNMGNSSDEARRVLDIASQIDRELSYSRGGGYSLQNDWGRLRSDLQVIADTYSYNSRGGWNNGGSRGRFPF